ncbi:ester cyclase [candidate division KSB1 bacterium]|nr:ester cyclase [candidate division KSB1 bacterium]
MKRLLLLFVFVSLGMAACTQMDNTAKENKAMVQRWVDAAWHNRNANAVDEFFSTNCIGHEGAVEVKGIESMRERVNTFHHAFSDIRVTSEEQVAAGDKIAVRWLIKATHQGEFMGIPATGKEVTWTGISIARIADGKFAEVWQDMDILGLINQLKAETPMK